MVSTEIREKQIHFHSQDLYNSVKIPVRDYLLELTQDLELAVLLNQIVFSKKEKLTLNDIKRLTLNEKTKQTIRIKLEQLIELGLIHKYKGNNLIYNQDLYEPTDKVISDNQDILALIEGIDLKYDFHYLTAALLNKFRTYALSGINEIRISASKLKSMLGVNNSESSIRLILKQLIADDYLSAELVYGVYNYKINVSKITNNYSADDINRFTADIFSIYQEYLKQVNISFSKSELKSHKMTIKRMLNDGYNPLILKHIFSFITLNYSDFKEFTTPAKIKKSYDKLYNLSKALSKRKSKRFIYKLKNNLLDSDKSDKDNPNQSRVVSDIEIWQKAVNYIDGLKGALQKWYYSSLAGVTDIDFDDFYQEALKAAYEYFKKNYDNDKFTISTIKYRLKDYMYQKRSLTDTFENKNAIINYEYDFDNLDLSICKVEEKPLEIDFDKNAGINKLLDILDDRSRFIIKHYIGYDGHSLTFKEIGKKLNLSESLIARIYKKAILLLKEHFPPDMEKEIRYLINNS